MSTNIRPRNDFCLIRQTRTSVSGLLMPDRARQGKINTVVAIGPKVEGLKIGDVVEFAGSPQTGEVAPVPNYADLFVMRQENIILIYSSEQQGQAEVPVPQMPHTDFGVYEGGD